MAVSGLTSDRSSPSSAPPCDLLACLHNLLHASHFICLEPDLNAARVEGGFRERLMLDSGFLHTLYRIYALDINRLFSVMPHRSHPPEKDCKNNLLRQT